MNELNHIAIIMDGNSSWAKKNAKPAVDGYLKGMRTMSNIIINLQEMGLKYSTFYAFSSENWNRPKVWVSEFMNLALWFFKNDKSIKKVLDIGAKLKVIGDKSKLSDEFQNVLNEYEEKTKSNEGVTVQIAISYGGRDDIVRAVRKIEAKGLEFSEASITEHLDTSGIPDPQLIIRTGSKQRLSNFLLWQASYSEFYFSDFLWPDFDKTELKKAIENFSKRERTYGK